MGVGQVIVRKILTSECEFLIYTAHKKKRGNPFELDEAGLYFILKACCVRDRLFLDQTLGKFLEPSTTTHTSFGTEFVHEELVWTTKHFVEAGPVSDHLGKLLECSRM